MSSETTKMNCIECWNKETRKDNLFCSAKCEKLHLEKVQNSFDFNRMMIAKGLREGIL